MLPPPGPPTRLSERQERRQEYHMDWLPPAIHLFSQARYYTNTDKISV